MSELPAVELVRGMWEASIRGEDVGDAFAPDFEFLPPAMLDGGVASYPSFGAFHARITARYPGARISMADFVPARGGNVLGIGRLAVDGGPGGTPGFSSLQATLYEVRHGRIVCAETFTDLEMAREAAGIVLEDWPAPERFAEGTIVRPDAPGER